MKEEDRSRTEKLKILVKKQGITTASIITAVGILICTIVLAVTGRGTEGVPGAIGGGSNGFIQNQHEILSKF